LVRKDLSPEQQAVQSCHAAIEASRWLIPLDIEHPHVIICGIDNQSKLNQAISKIKEADIRYQPFYEADIDNELTAIATEPVYGEKRGIFKRYNLLRMPSQRQPIAV
jgi:hypothetical protein